MAKGLYKLPMRKWYQEREKSSAQMKEREKCKITSHHPPQYAEWFSRYSILKSGNWQDGHRHFVGF